ncbi:unnamed protein product [Symbiodinium natans]|uniref:Uncharacterized protein n=1 Tax=Symbiodinium natans TaxID=878477 RepID=A0A812QBW0_9DINO|nr:unnamed protein product [Symbiodinium natans]
MAAEKKARTSNGGSAENLVAAASPLNDRGRSMSPVQTVSTTAAQSRSASGAMTHRGAIPHAWASGEGPAASPRTPRHPVGSELRLGVVVAELQRQGAEDRRLVQRQLDHLDRRLQEQLAMPAASRERWADLQGSVTGLLEEVAGLVRRVEGLDEKLRIRTASCEELLRQRTREVEQQVHSQQQKVQLAVSTFEEMSKRQTAKLRKVVQTSEEHARRMATLEEAYRRPQDTTMRLEGRLSELEGQQASLEEEFRNVAASTASQRLDSLSPSRRAAPIVHADDPGYDVVRALETELATLSKHLASQLDDHSSALASLRVRTDGQEQRLVAAGERLEKVVSPTLEALRAEMQQLRMADRSEMDQRFEHLARRLADSNEEAMSELRDLLQDHQADPAEGAVARLREACAAQDQQLRRLEALVDPGQSAQRDEDFCGLLVRVEGLEHRLELIDEEAISEKADRTELHRLDLAVQEISEPLRRLSQRTATAEARASNLEHKFEQLQVDHSPAPTPTAAATSPMNESFATRASLEALSQELAQAVARIVEMEALVQRPPHPQPASEALEVDASRVSALESSVQVVRKHMEHLEQHLKDQIQNLPARMSSAGEEAAHFEELSARVSKALKLAESSGSNMQSLRFDLVVEQERVGKLAEDMRKMSGRLELAESASEDMRRTVQELPDRSVHEPLSELQPAVQALTERFEASESRTSEALQKMLSSIDKVQVLQNGLEGSNRDLTNLVESLASRVEACEKRPRELAPAPQDLSTIILEAREAAASSVQEKLSEMGHSGKALKEDNEDVLKDMLKALKQELEEQKEQLTDKVTHAQFSASASDLTRKVEASEATVSAGMHDLEAKLAETLRKSKESEDSIREVRSIVDDTIQRVEATEAASKAVREELMNEDAHGEAYALARTCQNDLRGVHSDVADLQASLRSVVRRVEQDAIATAPRKQVSDGARRLELRVEELQKQVVEELEQLAEQQQLLAKVKPSTGGKPDVQDLEQSVERLAAQVAQELQDLKMHQGELGKARVRLQSDAGKAAPEVETKVLELQNKVLQELEALGKQQEELGKAKATMADLSDRVQEVVATVTECKKVTVGLEERLKRLSSIEDRAAEGGTWLCGLF